MDKSINLAKIGTADLEKKIASGKYAGETLTEMKALLKKRTEKLTASRAAATPAAPAKKAAPKKAAPAKKAAPKKEVPAKKAAPKKAAAAKKDTPVKKETVKKEDGIRGYLRTIITPKTGTVAAVTFSEAKAAVAKKFANWADTRSKALYPSEFNGVMGQLMKDKIITERKKTEYQKLEA